jgi:hypothetical protein
MNEILEISRQWNQTGTTIRVVSQGEVSGLSVSLPLSEVRRLLKEKIGSVAIVFTKKEFEKRVDEAFDSILLEMGKDTTPYAGLIPYSSERVE